MSLINSHPLFRTCGGVAVLGVEHGDDTGDAGMPGAKVDALGWLRLQHRGCANDDGACNRRSR